MTVVRDLDGEGHAILTVKTDRGEFVLDNLSRRNPPVGRDRAIRYVKRQSQSDPNVWLDLGGVEGRFRRGRRHGDGRLMTLRACARLARSCSDEGQRLRAEQTIG